MKILVLGNINSKWVKEFIEYDILPLKHSVEVLGEESNCKYTEFYKKNGITIHKLADIGSVISRIPFFRTLIRSSRTVNNNQWGQYDIIINMFVNYRDLFITSKVKTTKTKTILYFTGSDLLRKSKIAIKMNNLFLRKVDYYVMGSKTLLGDFYRKYGNLKNVEVISFGTSALINIDRCLKNNCVQRKKNTFCIGYSGVRAHQHLVVLSLFEKLPTDLKDKARIVVPMTYMATPDYIAQVQEKLENTGIKYQLLTTFMNNEEMAKMWCGIDYFINAQTTDSLSASVIESVYAGCELINPVWLEYPEYEEFGIKKRNYHDFNELYSIIVSILENKIQPIERSNRKLLYDSTSWETSRKKWTALLDSLNKIC